MGRSKQTKLAFDDDDDAEDEQEPAATTPDDVGLVFAPGSFGGGPLGGGAHAAAFARKMAQVQAAAGYVQKTGRNKHFKYSFVEAAQVYAIFRQALAEAGLAIVGTRASLLRLACKDGMWLAAVHVTVVVADVDTGYSSTFEAVGTGADSQDKCASKAHTAAGKYAVIGAVLASTGDDPEADDATDRPRRQRKRGKGGVARVEEPAEQDSDDEDEAPKAKKAPAEPKPKRVTKKEQLARDLAGISERIKAAKTSDALRAVKDDMLNFAGQNGFAAVRREFMDRAAELQDQE